MNEVNKTLFIPLYGKSQISKQGIILDDPMAEKIWEAEEFPIKGKYSFIYIILHFFSFSINDFLIAFIGYNAFRTCQLASTYQ